MTPPLELAKTAVAGSAELLKGILPPQQFATQTVGGILSFVGAIAPPLLTVALMGMGLKMVVTGQKPKILGG